MGSRFWPVRMSVIDLSGADEITIVDDDFGQGEQLKRESQLVEEAYAQVKATQSPQAMAELHQYTHKDKNRALMRQLGAIPLLFSILTGAAPPELNDKQAGALRLLAGISRNLPSREEIRKKGGIDLIVRLLPLHNEEQLSEVFVIASHLADNPKNRSVLAQRGVMEAAVSRMKSAQGHVLASILLLLSSMSTGDKKSQDLVCKEGGIPLTLHAIENPDINIRNAGMEAIGTFCAGNRKNQGLVRKSPNAMKILVSLLQDPDMVTRQMAAQVLGNIVENDFSNQTAFQKIGLLEALAAVVVNPNETASVKERACGTLVAMTNGNAKIQKAWVHHAELVQCATDPHSGVQAQALHAISELSSNNSPNSDKFIECGLLDALDQALRNDNEAVQYRATGACYSIIRKNPERRSIVGSHPNLPKLLNALKGSGNQKVKQGASWCLEELI